jgi:hypothetical protein
MIWFVLSAVPMIFPLRTKAQLAADGKLSAGTA